MTGRRALLRGAGLLGALAAGGCGARLPKWDPPRLSAPAPRPAPTPTATATPTPPPNLETRIKRQPWLTRFWEELTPAQRRRVQARLRAPSAEEAALAWDPMGLPERAALVR